MPSMTKRSFSPSLFGVNTFGTMVSQAWEVTSTLMLVPHSSVMTTVVVVLAPPTYMLPVPLVNVTVESVSALSTVPSSPVKV